MNEKILAKLVKKAVKVEEVEIDPSKLTEVTNLEDFYNLKGDLFMHENTFYKKEGEEFYCYFNEPRNLSLQEQQIKTAITQDSSIVDRISSIENWIKKYALIVQKDQEEITENISFIVKEIGFLKGELENIKKKVELLEKAKKLAPIAQNKAQKPIKTLNGGDNE